MFPQLYAPAALCSHSTMTTALCSHSSMIPVSVFPPALYSHGSIFPLLYVFTSICSHGTKTLCSHSYVLPTALCFHSLFCSHNASTTQLYVPTALRSESCSPSHRPMGRGPRWDNNVLGSDQSTDRSGRQANWGRFSRDALPVFFFFAGGHREQFWHGQGGPSLMLSVQHFLCRTQGRSSFKVS